MWIWHKYWARDYTFHYMELFLQYIQQPKKGEYLFKHYLLLRENNLFAAYSPVDEKEALYIYLLARYTTNCKDLKALLRKFMGIGERYYTAALKTRKKNLSQCSPEELIVLLKGYYKVWMEYTYYLWIIFNLGEAFCPTATEYIKTKAQRLDKHGNIPRYLAYMAAPSKRCSVLVLHDTLVQLKQKHQNIDLNVLYEEYQWLPWGDLHATPWTLHDIKEYVNSHTQAEEPLIDFSVMKNELQLTNKEIEIVQMSKELAYMRDLRDDYRRKTVFHIHFLYEEVARRCGVSYEDLMFYSTPELYPLLNGTRLKQSELLKRKGDCVVALNKGTLRVISRNEGKKYFDQVHQEDSVQEIKGLPARQGIVQGTVKVIRLDKELSKIKEGDIMVTLTTHPEYVTKMQIAKAIVTDEGGITCHAAIVARELGIPCIVGTKNATQILKDGDRVEVDATKGIVKKL